MVLAAGMLAACSAAGASGHEPSTAVTAGMRDEFLASVRNTQSWWGEPPADDEIAAYPPKWCAAMEQGHGVRWMLRGPGHDELYPVGGNWGTTSDDAELVVVKGITAYCPVYRMAAIESIAYGDLES